MHCYLTKSSTLLGRPTDGSVRGECMNTPAAQSTRLLFGTALGLWGAVAVALSLGRLPPGLNCDSTTGGICWASGMSGWVLPTLAVLVSLCAILSHRKVSWFNRRFPDASYEKLDEELASGAPSDAWARLELAMRQNDLISDEE